MASIDWGEYIWNKLWTILEKILLKGGYDSRRYWESRGKFFHIESYQKKTGWQHDRLIKTLHKLDWDSLLEVGCGFGRNLKIIRSEFPGPEKSLTGLDISKSMLKQGRRFLKNISVDLHIGSILTLPSFEEFEADIVLTHGLLMHVRPQEIQKAFTAISALANRYVICIEELIPASEESAVSQEINKFTFYHPYKKLFKDFGWVLMDQHEESSLGFYVFKKNVKDKLDEE